MATGLTKQSQTYPSRRMASDLINDVLRSAQADQGDDDLRAAALDALCSSIRRMNTVNWIKLRRRTGALPLAASKKRYDLPADFKDPYRFLLLNEDLSLFRCMEYMTPDRFTLSSWSTRGIRGRSSYYTIWHNDHQFEINRMPTEADVGNTPFYEILYYARLPYLTSEGDVLERVPSEFEEYMVQHARAEFCSYYAPTLAGSYEMKKQESWVDLNTSDNEIQSDIHSTDPLRFDVRGYW